MDSSDCIRLEINSLHYIKLFETGLSPSLLITVSHNHNEYVHTTTIIPYMRTE